jgi:hypothetical protein
MKYRNPRLGDIEGKKGAHQNDTTFSSSLYARAYYTYKQIVLVVNVHYGWYGWCLRGGKGGLRFR